MSRQSQATQMVWLSQPLQQQKSEFEGVEPSAASQILSQPPTNTANQPPEPAPTGFTQADLEDAIQKARSQEKDKLYPQLDALKDQVAQLTKEREERLEAERLAKEEAEAQARQEQEAEMDLRQLLETRERELMQQIEQERLEREQAFALLNKERSFNEVQQYKAQKIQEAGDEIMPELLDLVVGETPEEIDASIRGLVERSNRILEGAQAAMQQARQQMQGTRVTAPPTGPLDNETAQRQFSAEDIASMSMADYAKYRNTLIGNTQGNNRGLFG